VKERRIAAAIRRVVIIVSPDHVACIHASGSTCDHRPSNERCTREAADARMQQRVATFGGGACVLTSRQSICAQHLPRTRGWGANGRSHRTSRRHGWRRPDGRGKIRRCHCAIFPEARAVQKYAAPHPTPVRFPHVRSRMHESSTRDTGDNAAGKIAGAVPELGQFVW